MAKHFWDSWPREACGVITVDQEVIRFRNRSSKPDRFLVGPLQMLRALGVAGYRHGTGVQFVYHSHRNIPSPSKTDQGFMEYMARIWPGVDHLIFTPNGEYAVWRHGVGI